MKLSAAALFFIAGMATAAPLQHVKRLGGNCALSCLSNRSSLLLALSISLFFDGSSLTSIETAEELAEIPEVKAAFVKWLGSLIEENAKTLGKRTNLDDLGSLVDLGTSFEYKLGID
jgi:hypothetical protein